MSNLSAFFTDAFFYSTPYSSEFFSKNICKLECDSFNSSKCITIAAAKDALARRCPEGRILYPRVLISLYTGKARFEERLKKKSCNWMSGDRGGNSRSRLRPIVRVGNVCKRKSITLRRRCSVAPFCWN